MFSSWEEDLVLVKKDSGEKVPFIAFSVESEMIYIHDPADKLPIDEGDTIERTLPNGLTEEYVVLDRGYNVGANGTEYQAKVVKKKRIALEREANGNTYYVVGSPGAHVNVLSHDSSQSSLSVDQSHQKLVLNEAALFNELRDTLRGATLDAQTSKKLFQATDAMEKAVGKRTFATKYKAFIGLAADHLTLVAPFIPALTKLLGGP